MPGKKKDEEKEPMTLTDLISEVFRIGFETAKNEAYVDSDEALNDEAVCEDLAKIHEEFGNQMLSGVETILDMDSDSDDYSTKEEDEDDEPSKDA